MAAKIKYKYLDLGSADPKKRRAEVLERLLERKAQNDQRDAEWRERVGRPDPEAERREKLSDMARETPERSAAVMPSMTEEEEATVGKTDELRRKDPERPRSNWDEYIASLQLENEALKAKAFDTKAFEAMYPDRSRELRADVAQRTGLHGADAVEKKPERPVDWAARYALKEGRLEPLSPRVPERVDNRATRNESRLNPLAPRPVVREDTRATRNEGRLTPLSPRPKEKPIFAQEPEPATLADALEEMKGLSPVEIQARLAQQRTAQEAAKPQATFKTDTRTGGQVASGYNAANPKKQGETNAIDVIKSIPEDVFSGMYDMTVGTATGTSYEKIKEESKNNKGVGIPGFLKAAALSAAQNYNDTLLGIAENYGDFVLNAEKLLGFGVDPEKNPVTPLRQKNAEIAYKHLNPLMQNATGLEKIFINAASSAINSAAMMAGGAMLGKATTSMMGGGLNTVYPVSRVNRTQAVANAAQMAPFAAQSATEAYDKAEESGLNHWQAGVSALTAGLMSLATNSSAYEDYCKKIGLGAETNDLLYSKMFGAKMNNLGQAAYEWFKDAMTIMAPNEAVQEGAESLALKLNQDMWNGTFFDASGWQEWGKDVKSDMFYGYLSGALFYATALPAYAESAMMAKAMINGEIETTPETLSTFITQTMKDAQDPKMSAEAKMAIQQDNAREAAMEPSADDPLMQAAMEAADAGTKPDMREAEAHEAKADAALDAAAKDFDEKTGSIFKTNYESNKHLAPSEYGAAFLGLYGKAKNGEIKSQEEVNSARGNLSLEAATAAWNAGVAARDAATGKNVKSTEVVQEQHTPEQQQVIKEYEEAVDDRILRLAKMYRADSNAQRMQVKITSVSPEMAADSAPLLGFDPIGYQIYVGRNTFNHIERRHGENGQQDKSMSDLRDVARMGYVIKNYDTIDIARDKNGNQVFSKIYQDKNNRPAPVLLLSKRVDGVYYVAEAVPDSAQKRIIVQSCYKTKSEVTQAHGGNPEGPVQETSETHLAYPPDKNSIPDGTRKSNIAPASLLTDDGKTAPVNVAGVHSVERGKVYLDVTGQDGKTSVVSADDVTFQDDATEGLLASGAAEKMNADGANALFRGYDASLAAPEEYADAFGGIYSRAKTGMSYQAALGKGKDVQTYLTEDARRAAWAAGNKVARKKPGLYKAYTQSAFDRLGNVENKRRVMSDMDALEMLAKKTGRAIRIVDSIGAARRGKDGTLTNGANGYYNQATGEITIALDAQDGAYLYIGMHELTHALKSEHWSKWQAFEDYVSDALIVQGVDVDAAVQHQMKTFGYDADAALEEVICNSVPAVLRDEGNLKKLLETDRTLYQKVMDFIKAFMGDVKAIGEKLAGRKGWEQMNALAKDEKALGEIYDQMMGILEEKGGEARTAEDAEAGKKHSVSDSFETDYDAWARDKKPYVTITVGTTSKALTTLGAKEQTVVMRSDDVIHALRHDGMTDDIIKQIPQMMESPIIVMKSLNLGDKNDHDASRAIMYGNVIDENGAPVIAVLELRERQKGGQVLDMQLVKNAYGKDHGLDAQIQKSEILYLDPDKERTNGWLHGIGLQLPPDTTNYGSIGSISYPDGFVKMDGVRFADLGKTNKNSAIQEPHRGVTVSSSLADATSMALNNSISKANENVNKKYSLRSTDSKDSKDRDLTEAQTAFFSESKARDASGQLLPLYHGTENTGFTTFKQRGNMGYFFTDSQPLAKVYSGRVDQTFAPGKQDASLFEQEAIAAYTGSTEPMEPERGGIYEAYLNLTTPLELDAKGAEWDKVRGKAKGDAEEQTLTTDEWVELACEQGYDGLIVRDVQDGNDERNSVYVAFEPGQIKSVNNTEPTNDTDIRYSLRETDEAVQDELETLKTVFSMTPGHRITAAEADTLAGKLLKSVNSSYDQKKLAQEIAEIYDFAEQSEEPDMAQIDDEQTALMAKVLEKSTTLDMEHEEAAQPVREYLRKTPVRLTETQQKEAANQAGTYGAYRKTLFGRVRLSGGAETALDQIWPELSNLAPQWFPADAAEGDMPRLLTEAVDAMKPVFQNENGFGVEEAAQYLAGEMNSAYMALPAVQAQAKERSKLNATAAEYRKMQTAFADSSKQAFGEALKAVSAAKKLQTRTEQQQRVEALRKKYAAWREKDTMLRRERERKTKYGKRVENTVSTLLGWLDKPTDKKHVDVALEAPVRELLAALDFSGKGTKAAKSLSEQIEKLADGMDKELNSGKVTAWEYDQEIVDELHRLAVITKEKANIYDLNGADMMAMSRWMDALKHVITTANEMRANERFKTVDEAAEASKAQLRGKKPLKDKQGFTKKWADLVDMGMMDSFSFFERLGTAANAVFMGARRGFDRMAEHVQNAAQYTQNMVKESGLDIRALGGEKAKKQAFQLQNGGTVELTRAAMMELYELDKRDQARGHLYSGGIRVEGDENVHPHTLTPADVESICGNLTDAEKKLADDLQHYMATDCAAWGNETSRKLLGYDKFTEEHYYPIRTNSNETQSRSAEPNSNAGFYRLANQGMTKATVEGASNSMILVDIFDTYAAHISEIASYNAYAPAISDLVRWYNHPGVKTEIEQVMGKNGLRYVADFIKAVNGSREGTSADGLTGGFNKMMRGAKTAAVGANVRVIVQQPTSYLRAAYMISPKYLSQGMVMRPKNDLVNKYCGIALWKSYGFYETDVGPGLRQMIVNDASTAEKIRSGSLWLAGKADEMTLNALWNACELETRKLRPELTQGTEAYYRAVGARLSDIIDRTQVVDSVFHRSQMMRSKDGLTKMLTAFMAEPTKSYNMIAAAVANYAENRKNPAARAKLARALVTFAATGVATAAAAAVIDAFRDDDDEKTWLEKYLAALKDNTIGNLNPLGLIPGLKDVMSLFEGYSPSRLDQQGMQRIIQAVNEIKKFVDGESKQNAYGVVYKCAHALSGVTGIPLSSAMRTFNSLYQTITGDNPMLSETGTFTYAAENLYHAMLTGDADKQKRIRDKLSLPDKDGKPGKNPSEIDGAVAAVLKTEDERIARLYELKAAGKAEKANALKQQIAADGLTGEIVDRAVLLHEADVEKEENPKEKDMTKELKAKLYSGADFLEAVRGMKKGGSLSDAQLIFSEMVADSEGKDPVDGARSTVSTAAQPELVKLVRNGKGAEAKELAEALTEVAGIKRETLDGWLEKEYGAQYTALREGTDRAAANALTTTLKAAGVDQKVLQKWATNVHGEKMLTSAAAFDTTGAKKYIKRLQADGLKDSEIKSKLTNRYKDVVVEAYKKGDRATVRKWKTYLMGLGLKSKDGEKLFTEDKFWKDWGVR